MGADKPYIHELDGKLDNHHQAMIVSLDVEHIVLVAHIVHTVERSLHIGKASPLTSLDDCHPFLQGSACVRMPLYVLLQGLFRKYPHHSYFAAKIMAFSEKQK